MSLSADVWFEALLACDIKAASLCGVLPRDLAWVRFHLFESELRRRSRVRPAKILFGLMRRYGAAGNCKDVRMLLWRQILLLPIKRNELA